MRECVCLILIVYIVNFFFFLYNVICVNCEVCECVPGINII